MLLVEDSGGLRAAIRSQLESVNARVIEAADGQEALDLYKEHCASIHCVLLDVDLPKLNGRECLKKMRQWVPHLSGLLMSGDMVRSCVLECLKKGGVSC